MSHHALQWLVPAALAMAMLPLAARADGLDYNYLQAGYDFSHNSDTGRDAHGWNAGASAAVGSNFQVFGGGGVSDGAVRSGQSWNLGGGFHAPVSASTDLVGDVAFHHGNFDGVAGDARSWTGEIGVRSALAPHVEGWLLGGYTNTRSDVGAINRPTRDQAFAALGGQYKFDSHWGLVAQGRIGSRGERGIFIGPRFSF